MLAILTSPQKFWICLLNTEADCGIYFFLVALKNHDILNSQIAFDWHINHLFTSAVTTPIMPPYTVRRTDSSSKSQCQFYRYWMSMSFCWESISFAYFVSFWYAYGMLLPYLSKGTALSFLCQFMGFCSCFQNRPHDSQAKKHILLLYVYP